MNKRREHKIIPPKIIFREAQRGKRSVFTSLTCLSSSKKNKKNGGQRSLLFIILSIIKWRMLAPPLIDSQLLFILRLRLKCKSALKPLLFCFGRTKENKEELGGWGGGRWGGGRRKVEPALYVFLLDTKLISQTVLTSDPVGGPLMLWQGTLFKSLLFFLSLSSEWSNYCMLNGHLVNGAYNDALPQN